MIVYIRVFFHIFFSYHGHALAKTYGLRIYAIMLPSSGFSVAHWAQMLTFLNFLTEQEDLVSALAAAGAAVHAANLKAATTGRFWKTVIHIPVIHKIFNTQYTIIIYQGHRQSIVAAQWLWSKHHCYKKAPLQYDLRCWKATLNPNKQTNKHSIVFRNMS